MNIRPMQSDDVAILAPYWYDKMALLQQYNRHITLAPDAQNTWQKNAQEWLDEFPQFCHVAVVDADVLGGIFGAIQPNEIGLLPLQIGMIRAFTLDLHAPRGQGGIGKKLVTTLQSHLKAYDITQLFMPHWRGWAVETAFLQTIGVKIHREHYRIDLT